MKTTSICVALAALALGASSCNNENEPANNAKYITVSTEIATRVATSGSSQIFEEGDQISVYAWTGSPTAVSADRVVDNAVNTLTSGAWVANPQMLWKNTTDDHYFIGVYPQTSGSVADLTAGDYTLDVDDQEKSDLLVATNLDGLKSGNNPSPVLLTFNHVMAKLKVSLQFRNQWGSTAPTVESVTIKGAASTATVNYLTQKVEVEDTRDIKLPVAQANKEYESVVIPQDNLTSIVVTIGNKEYVYTAPSSIKLESGKVTNVGLIVGRNEITLGTVSINDWETGTTIEGGEAQVWN